MFKVYSVYDTVSERSVLISMNYTDEEAIRAFKEGLKHIPNRANDLELLFIGTFDASSLLLTAVDNPILVVEGSSFDFESEVK